MKMDNIDYDSAYIDYDDSEDAWDIWADIIGTEDEEYLIATFYSLADAEEYLQYITGGVK